MDLQLRDRLELLSRVEASERLLEDGFVLGFRESEFLFVNEGEEMGREGKSER